MRTLIISLLFYVAYLPLVVGQDLFVVHLKGDIYNKTHQADLKTGTKISSDDELLFKSQDAVAVVLSTTKGRMVLDGKEATKNDDGEFLSIAKNVLLPLKSNMKMSTRGGDSEQIVNLKDFFGTERYAIIGNRLELSISQTKYPLNENFKMIAKYTVDSKQSTKYLPYEGNKLILEKNQLLAGVEGIDKNAALFGDLSLFYLDVAREYPEALVTFLPVFIDEERLIEEFNNYIKIMESAGLAEDEDMEDNLFSFVNDIYGTIDEELFFDWLYEQDDIRF